VLRAFPAESTVDAGGTLILHVATDAPRFRVCLERWSGRREVVHDAGSFAGEDAPAGSCDAPWDWPRIAIGLSPHLEAGAYVARLRPDGGTRGRGQPHDDSPDARWGTVLFVVRARSKARVVVNLPLFTYHAYNVAHVDGTLGEGDGECLYSGSRTVTLRRPGGGTGGHPWDEVNADAYDRTSPRQTFAHWDQRALAWFAREGIRVDVCTDLDLHRGSVNLEQYALLCTFGHDEYWTREKRARVERWIEGGGRAAFFGGNTCWFRVRFDEVAGSITRDGSWSDDDPEDTLTGISYRRGGGKWIGARPATGFRIEGGSDPLLRDAGLQAGDVVGAASRLVGYECDGIDPAHAPAALRVLGRATLNGWRVSDGSGTIQPGGHAAMVTFARGQGAVFNAGTTDWARVLASGDAGVHAITAAVVQRFSAREPSLR
jgi:N,N-dimethylformamidase beta subunit-like protein